MEQKLLSCLSVLLLRHIITIASLPILNFYDVPQVSIIEICGPWDQTFIPDSSFASHSTVQSYLLPYFKSIGLVFTAADLLLRDENEALKPFPPYSHLLLLLVSAILLEVTSDIHNGVLPSWVTIIYDLRCIRLWTLDIWELEDEISMCQTSPKTEVRFRIFQKILRHFLIIILNSFAFFPKRLLVGARDLMKNWKVLIRFH